ncbi:hypothetical protein HYV49_05325 [Candidatus Pacearchaeota archaeon]|nr:hypothetical protein [Candidatus Pacearchaeota archaeon]
MSCDGRFEEHDEKFEEHEKLLKMILQSIRLACFNHEWFCQTLKKKCYTHESRKAKKPCKFCEVQANLPCNCILSVAKRLQDERYKAPSE